MKTRALVTLGMSALALGGAMAGYAGGFTAFAGTRESEALAAKQAGLARASLSRGKGDAAVKAAELAVGYAPRTAEYRVLLGQSYLKAGRFDSARSAFADALSLDPANGKAALHLALTQIGTGDWDGARRTLDANASIIPVSDRGLAVALAGDPAAAVELLGDAARAPEADAKTRQNFALALALAGRWTEAKTVVAMDVSPDQVDARLLEWSNFAKPTSASDQVASLLGVTPVQDAGQPTALALNPSSNGTAVAAQAPVDSFMPKAPPEVTGVAVADAAPVETPQLVAASVSNVSFAARKEVLQALPARAVSDVPGKKPAMGASKANTVPVWSKPAKPGAAVPKSATAQKAVVAPVPTPKGDFFVQLGAFDNAAVAKDAWARAKRIHSGFAAYSPLGVPVTTKAGTFYRLSVGGFSRAAADTLCRSYKAKGGQCFVRVGAGDKMAAWVKPGVRLASLRTGARVSL